MIKHASTQRSNGRGNTESCAKSSAVHRINGWMEKFSLAVTQWAGSSWAFALAFIVVLLWAVTGPMFGFSETWQLVINTGTTIVTFLMVFLIQRSQNKESLAIQIKLDELLASQPGASNRLINLEQLQEEEVVDLHERFTALRKRLESASENNQSHSIEEAKEVAVDAQDALEQAQEKGRHRRSKQHAKAK